MISRDSAACGISNAPASFLSPAANAAKFESVLVRPIVIEAVADARKSRERQVSFPLDEDYRRTDSPAGCSERPSWAPLSRSLPPWSSTINN